MNVQITTKRNSGGKQRPMDRGRTFNAFVVVLISLANGPWRVTISHRISWMIRDSNSSSHRNVSLSRQKAHFFARMTSIYDMISSTLEKYSFP